jgi:putative hemolysin
MKKLYFLVFFISIKFVFAEDYILQSEGTQVKIPFTKVEEFLVNDICIAKGKDCKAIKAAKFKGKTHAYKKQNLSSPAQDFCKVIGGTALTLLKVDLSGISFCAFDDQTIISSWDLYNKRNKK